MINKTLIILSCFLTLLVVISAIVHEIGVNQHLYVIDIDNAEKNDEILLSEICSNVKTIILETNDSVLIKQDGGVQVYKDYIFVLNKSDDACLYAFSKEGRFIRKYGNRGNGPGEYLSIKDFTIDTENDIIYLMDDDANQILLYDINTGKYMNKIKLERKTFNCFHLQYNNNKLYTDINYWHINESGCMLQKIDQTTGQQQQCWLDPQYNKGWNGGISIIDRLEESPFYVRHQEACKYIFYFADTIISIGKNQIESYAVIKEKNWITSKDISQIAEDLNYDKVQTFQTIRNKGFSYNINSYMEWNDFISFFYIKNHYKYFVLYNKKTGKTRTTQSLTNDMAYGKPWIVNGFSCSDENGLYEIIGMFSLNRYLERIKEDNFLKRSLDKYEELKNLPEDTNPVIFYYEFK